MDTNTISSLILGLAIATILPQTQTFPGSTLETSVTERNNTP